MTDRTTRLRLVSGRYDDLLSLRAWLADEDALRGHVHLERSPTPAGRMGVVTDVLLVAAGAGGAATALARSIPLWLRRNVEVTVELRTPDGTTVTVSAKGAADAESAITAVLNRTGADRPRPEDNQP